MPTFQIDKTTPGMNWAGFSYASGTGTSYVSNPWEINGTFDALMPPATISKLYADGVRVIRLAVDPTPLCMTTADWQMDGMLGVLFNPVKKFTDAGFKVIFDFHFQDYPAIAGTGFDTWGLMAGGLSNPKYIRAVQVLRYVASKLATYHPTAAVGIFNEPPGNQPGWPAMAKDIFTKVRQVAPNTTIVIAGDSWANVSGLIKLNPADFDSNTIFDFHSYLQRIFTHQSINPAIVNPDKALGYISRLPFPPVAADKPAVLAQGQSNIANQIWGTTTSAEKAALNTQLQSFLDYYFGQPCDTAFIKAQEYDPLAAWMAAKGVSGNRVMCGETGVWKDALGKQGATWTSAVNYLSAQKSLCDAIGCAVFFWEMQGTSNTAWWLTETYGADHLHPEVVKVIKQVSPSPGPGPAPAPTPPAPVTPTILGKGTYQLPGGVIVTVP